tara:strand:- start:3654 stop:4619 length:966 start_codon:yes stop_codon:yes gene_type:complete
MSNENENESAVWHDALHPESVKAYGIDLLKRAEGAKLFQTGLVDWDRACDDTGGGLDDFWYVVIGGASNVGKTQLLISLAKQGLLQKFAVVVVTMEEPLEQIQRRIYAGLSDLGYHDFTYKNFSRSKAARLVETTPYVGKLAINGDLPKEDLKSIIEYLDEARDMLFGRPMIVILDNLQLVKPENGSSIASAATEVSEGLRRWAKVNRTLTFALSQVTSEALRAGRPVRCHDLWGGSSMYSNPSQVIMLDHLNAVVDDHRPWIKRLWGLVDKNRYGPKMVFLMLEANMKTGDWRCGTPDEEILWGPNPWAPPEDTRGGYGR